MNKTSDHTPTTFIAGTIRLVKFWYKKISAFSHTDTGKVVRMVGSYLFQGIIVLILLYQLTEIGWSRFFASLPTQPLYYLIFLVIYFALPIAEIFAYGFSWDFRFWEAFPVFIKKRVYNKNVLGYSGELKLFTWARNTLEIADKETFKVVRDNNIVSSVSSTLVAMGLLIAFLQGRHIRLLQHLQQQNNALAIGGTIIFAIIIGAVLFYYRRYFFSMSRKVALSVFGIHVLRLLVINVAQILQWNVVMPEIELSVWFTFLSMQLIMSRIPLLPNKDLIFIGASLEVSNLVNVSSAGIAGLLIVQNVLDKVLNVGLYIVLSMIEKRKKAKQTEWAESTELPD